MEHGYLLAEAPVLKGARIYLDYPSVGATENILMAAALAEGTTIIENAAEEPEIVDLANFINSMGGKIIGAGTNVIKIEGVKSLGSTIHTVILIELKQEVIFWRERLPAETCFWRM